MIIWINGAFGAGKSQTAYELQRRIANSFVYDPENAGSFIQKNIPANMKKADFQNHFLWRDFNFRMLHSIHIQFQGTIIVPMTIVNPQYFDEIIGRLRNEGVVMEHFTLMATKETLLKRLRTRFDGKNSWAAQQIDRCLEGLSHSIFESRIDTNRMTIDEVVIHIASQLKIDLLPDHRGPLRKKIDRIITQFKQIR